MEDNSNIKLHNCANDTCINKLKIIVYNSKMIYLNKCMGLVYFYYPDELHISYNQANSQTNNRSNLENNIIMEQCCKAPYHKQFIHYCEDCMVDNSILYERPDKLETPYGNKNGKIFN